MRSEIIGTFNENEIVRNYMIRRHGLMTDAGWLLSPDINGAIDEVADKRLFIDIGGFGYRAREMLMRDKSVGGVTLTHTLTDVFYALQGDRFPDANGIGNRHRFVLGDGLLRFAQVEEGFIANCHVELSCMTSEVVVPQRLFQKKDKLEAVGIDIFKYGMIPSGNDYLRLMVRAVIRAIQSGCTFEVLEPSKYLSTLADELTADSRQLGIEVQGDGYIDIDELLKRTVFPDYIISGCEDSERVPILRIRKI